MMMFSSSDVEQIHAQIDEVVKTINLPKIDIARIFLFRAEELAREAAKDRLAEGRTLYEPDFVHLAEKIAGVVDHTCPDRQCR